MIKIFGRDLFGGKKEEPKKTCEGCGKPVNECTCEKESEE